MYTGQVFHNLIEPVQGFVYLFEHGAEHGDYALDEPR